MHCKCQFSRNSDEEAPSCCHGCYGCQCRCQSSRPPSLHVHTSCRSVIAVASLSRLNINLACYVCRILSSFFHILLFPLFPFSFVRSPSLWLISKMISTIILLSFLSRTLAANDWSTPCFNGVCSYESNLAAVKIVSQLSSQLERQKVNMSLVGFCQCYIRHYDSWRLDNLELRP